ncbi:hypothetical protein [Bernardetia sp. MNP-M8]|uniref:hypothetical protein n=1 Tax=Bernardetia sp. MNP-M8 TaxID=3127470 RepID=UPI0030CBD1C6
MQKYNYLNSLIFTLFLSLVISSCQKEEIEEGKFSCIPERINYYNEEGELIKYTDIMYKGKRKIQESTTSAWREVPHEIKYYKYDNQNRLISYEIKRPRLFINDVPELEERREISYDGNSRIEKLTYYRDNSMLSERVYTYLDDLLMQEDYYRDNLLINKWLYTYENGLIKTSQRIQTSGDVISPRFILYEYENGLLVKIKHYWSVAMSYYDFVKSYTVTTEGNTTLYQGYDKAGNIIEDKIIEETDEYGNIIYSFTIRENSYNEIFSEEINYEYTYNQHRFITSTIRKTILHKNYGGGRPSTTGNIYFHEEYANVKCY